MLCYVMVPLKQLVIRIVAQRIGPVMLCYVMRYGAPSTARQLCRRKLGVAASCDISSMGGATHK
jgi:hypothetical protein